MAANTKISWADSTCNLWIGCVEVSPACDHCYARELAERYGWTNWGGPRVRCAQGWKDARKFQRAANDNGGVDPELGRRRRVFVNSLSDFFDNHRTVTWRDEAWQLIRECPDVIFMLLTKRPENIRKMLPADWGDGWDNVWIGTTVEDQQRADHRIPHLLAVPARVRFLSMEPLLEQVILKSDWLMYDSYAGEKPKIHWIIAGGESGAKARPMNPIWVQLIRDRAKRFGIAFHFKQWGEWAPMAAARIVSDGPVTDRWGNVRDWMRRYVVFEDDAGAARVRGHSFTVHSTDLVYRIGTKSAGNQLDGREHLEFPEDVRMAA